jgi:hypothetical protein
MNILFKTFFVIHLFINPVFAQWELGGLFNYKNEIPEIGFGIRAARKLPFQWPTIGLKVRAGIDLFSINRKIFKRRSAR